MKYFKHMTMILFSVGVIVPSSVFAHGGNTEIKHKEMDSNQRLHAYKIINNEYVKSIKPIFEKKCFDCHGNITKFPWYYKVPGVKQMVDYDIKEGKKHLDMSKDFPFISHVTPLKDLEGIKEVSIEGDMPPLRYVLGHWDSRLTEREKQSILSWSKASIQMLKGVPHK